MAAAYRWATSVSNVAGQGLMQTVPCQKTHAFLCGTILRYPSSRCRRDELKWEDAVRPRLRQLPLGESRLEP